MQFSKFIEQFSVELFQLLPKLLVMLEQFFCPVWND